MKSNEEQLRNRGYIDDNDLEAYKNFTKVQLIELLQSDVPANRTIAAKSLVQYKDIEVIEGLISRLIIEKKLYTKIALSESIGNFGEKACERLIKYLGTVGNNQHKSLPNKPFNKKSYPLPRDIIARTICKIGVPALKHLRRCLRDGDYKQILEAVDAIGFISYYEQDTSCLEDVIELLNRYKNDNVMTWKLLRALQAFKDEKVLGLLEKYTVSDIEQHRWEANRSIDQINRR